MRGEVSVAVGKRAEQLLRETRVTEKNGIENRQRNEERNSYCCQSNSDLFSPYSNWQIDSQLSSTHSMDHFQPLSSFSHNLASNSLPKVGFVDSSLPLSLTILVLSFAFKLFNRWHSSYGIVQKGERWKKSGMDQIWIYYWPDWNPFLQKE